MSRVALLDATAGVAGDMCLGALVDAGLPLGVLQDVASRLALGDLRVTATPVRKGPLAATQVEVVLDGRPIETQADPVAHAQGPAGAHGHGHRTLPQVLEALGRLGDLDAPPLEAARRAFELLAEAEGRVHGVAPEAVRFHEVGAADALVDVAGTCLGLAALGIEQVHATPLPWSTGTVEAAHGTLSLPAPATVRLLEGVPTTGRGEAFEQVTPTGAALVRALCRFDAPPPAFVPEATGYGAGHHPGGALPNVVRLVVGHVAQAPSGPEEVVELATNLDDVTGQVVARALERARAAGALDAWVVPATMKKGRPGAVLHVLARPGDVARLEGVLFAETPTLGVRRHRCARTVLPRHHETVETPWGPVRMKVRETPDGPAGTPEHDDCRALADARGISLSRVLDGARAAWAASGSGSAALEGQEGP